MEKRKMATRQTYTVLVPFPTGGGHWSSVGQDLDLLDVEASAAQRRSTGTENTYHPGQKGRCQEG